MRLHLDWECGVHFPLLHDEQSGGSTDEGFGGSNINDNDAGSDLGQSDAGFLLGALGWIL